MRGLEPHLMEKLGVERGDVSATLSKRCQEELHHGEPLQEIEPKGAMTRLTLEITPRGRHNSDIDPTRLTSSYGRDLPRLHGP